jgi:hypothetical protein
VFALADKVIDRDLQRDGDYSFVRHRRGLHKARGVEPVDRGLDDPPAKAGDHRERGHRRRAISHQLKVNLFVGLSDPQWLEHGCILGAVACSRHGTDVTPSISFGVDTPLAVFGA